jgi:hypothetical protein
MAEEEARRGSCSRAVLSTAHFQAPGFYLKQGYEVATRIDCEPPGHTRFYMTKKLYWLSAAGAAAGCRSPSGKSSSNGTPAETSQLRDRSQTGHSAFRESWAVSQRCFGVLWPLGQPLRPLWMVTRKPTRFNWPGNSKMLEAAFSWWRKGEGGCRQSDPAAPTYRIRSLMFHNKCRDAL